MTTNHVASLPGRSYTEAFKQQAVRQLQQQSLRTVSKSLGVSKNSLVRWKNQVHVDTQSPAPLPVVPPFDTTHRLTPAETVSSVSTHPLVRAIPGHDILQLLREGQSVAQVATQLQLSKSIVRRWQLKALTPDFQPMDKRRLYTDAFRQEALQQMQQGISVRQLSQTLGVSQVTLHKWKQQAATSRLDDLTTRASAPLPDQPDMSTPSPDSDKPGDYRYDLRRHLRELQEERDVLKKALIILLRAS